MVKSIFVAAGVVLVSMAFTAWHLRYTADDLAAFTGYFVSVGVVPAVFGALVGLAGCAVLARGVIPSLSSYWWVAVVGALAAIGEVLLVIWRMSSPEH